MREFINYKHNSTKTVLVLTALMAAVSSTIAQTPPVLLHRYSFSEAAGSTTVQDSAGTANGTLVNGSATSTLGGGQLILDGNLSSAYVALPTDILSTLTNATFQTWVTWYGGPVWQRMFDFGTNFNGNGVSYVFVSPDNGATRLVRYAVNSAGETVVDGNSTLAISNKVAVTVTYNNTNATASIYIGGRLSGSGIITNKPLYNIPVVNAWVGRSQFNADAFFQGAYDEFRIYSGVKSDLQVAIDAAVGPDTIVTDPGALLSLSVSLPSTNLDAHVARIPLQVMANFVNVSNVDVSTLAQTVNASSDSSVANVVNGSVIPRNAGTASISTAYGGKTASVAVLVVDTNSWPAVLHRYSFNNAPATNTSSSSAPITDSVGTAHGTFYGTGTFSGSQLVLPTGSFTPNADGTHNTNQTGFVLLPPGIISTLPNEAAFEFWVTYRAGNVWQEMMAFGQGATPGKQSGGGNYLMICPVQGAAPTRRLRVEWFGVPGATSLVGPAELPRNNQVHVILTHDQDRQLDRLYVNGVLQVSGTVTAKFSSLTDNDNYLVCDQWPDPNFNGSYNEFRIWNGALTEGQVMNLFKVGPDIIAGPELKIATSGGQVSFKWPANATGFVLQSLTNLLSGNWVGVPGTPTAINGVNNLTVAGGQTQIFYRLKQ